MPECIFNFLTIRGTLVHNLNLGPLDHKSCMLQIMPQCLTIQKLGFLVPTSANITAFMVNTMPCSLSNTYWTHTEIFKFVTIRGTPTHYLNLGSSDQYIQILKELKYFKEQCKILIYYKHRKGDGFLFQGQICCLCRTTCFLNLFDLYNYKVKQANSKNCGPPPGTNLSLK